MNKHDLKAYREKAPTIYSLTPGVNTIETVGGAPLSKVGGPGSEMGSLPMTTRYDANKTSFINKPQFNNTYKGNAF